MSGAAQGEIRPLPAHARDPAACHLETAGGADLEPHEALTEAHHEAPNSIWRSAGNDSE